MQDNDLLDLAQSCRFASGHTMAAMTDTKPVVLIVEDDETSLRLMTVLLRDHARIIPVADPRQVPGHLRDTPPDAVLVDLNLPHLSGEALLRSLHADDPELPVIVVTGVQDATLAVRLVREGAFASLVTPVDPKSLLEVVRRALGLRRGSRSAGLQARLERPPDFAGFVTADKQMYRIFQYIEAVAPSASPVLITGETGTGKELVAQALHASSRRSGACVACNIGGLDDTLVSDALFGHRKGAFTGANSDRPGLIERAAGGTLFLDEIGDLPVPSQVKLLRLLQEGEYQPLGSDSSVRSDIRVVAATSLELEERIADGRFRRDLYYRLCGHRVHLPPLRERQGDLPLLIASIAERSARALGIPPVRIPPQVLDLCLNHPFPGNIRELQALVHDAVSRRRHGQISVEPFRALTGRSNSGGIALPPPTLTFPARLPSIDETVGQLVSEALRRSDGNQAAAARMLGISRQAMSQRLKQKQRKDLPHAGDGTRQPPHTGQ